MFINEYISNIDLRLIPSLDVFLSTEYINEENPDDFLISSFVISSETTSNVIWDEASIDENICNEMHYLSGRKNNKAFILNEVSGDTFCYNLSGNTLNGGFYQGYYKAEGYEYQVLPNRYLKGATFEFLLNKRDLENDCVDKFRLNDVYENNKGFFFYFGLNKENPYCSREVSGNTCEGIPYEMDYENVTVYPWEEENPFLYYTEDNVCNQEISFTYKYPSCCEGIGRNALGVRVTDDGKINVRFLDYSGSCISGYTHEDMILVDYTTEKSHIVNENDHHIVLKFENISYDDDCDLFKEKGIMELSVWVDGYQVLCEKVPELYGEPLNLHRSLQVGLPYNISVGGGTLGNIDNPYDIVDYNNRGCKHSFCFDENHGGFLGYETMSGETIMLTDFLEDDLKTQMDNLFLGEVILELHGKECKIYKGEINHNSQIKHLIFNNFVVPLNILECYQILSDDPCEIIEMNFAGTFIGNINIFNIYEKALTVQEIRMLTDRWIRREVKCC